MADIATIGVLHERVIRDSRDLSSQLELALESRIAIEQAKGIVAEHNQVGVDQAFELIRRYTAITTSCSAGRRARSSTEHSDPNSSYAGADSKR